MASDEYDDDFYDEREKALEELWRADFRRAADSLHDIGVLMINLSEIMKKRLQKKSKVMTTPIP